MTKDDLIEVNGLLQKCIEKIPDSPIQLTLADIKWELNKRYYDEQRPSENTLVPTLPRGVHQFNGLSHDDPS